MPKKRGPKTDVLEALLKRVDGLEAKLKEKNTEDGTAALAVSSSDLQNAIIDEHDMSETPEPPAKRFARSESNSPPEANVATFAAEPNPPPMFVVPYTKRIFTQLTFRPGNLPLPQSRQRHFSTLISAASTATRISL